MGVVGHYVDFLGPRFVDCFAWIIFSLLEGPAPSAAGFSLDWWQGARKSARWRAIQPQLVFRHRSR